MDRAGDAIRHSSAGEGAVTARSVLYGAAHRVLLGAVRLAVEENSVSRDHVAVQILAFYRPATEG